jgi:hypothetical protein
MKLPSVIVSPLDRVSAMKSYRAREEQAKPEPLRSMGPSRPMNAPNASSRRLTRKSVTSCSSEDVAE